jgi:hypothetical protein
MKVHFDNNEQIELELVLGAATTTLEKVYKHLQHVPLKFTKWDNPFYLDNVSFKDLVDNLVIAGQAVGVAVDSSQCIPFQQNYLNYLHKIYEKNYDGTPEWLDYHEQIHLCEFHYHKSSLRVATIDHRGQSGLLVTPFNKEYLRNLTTQIAPGEVYVEWSELGKIPYDYWLDNEPNDIDRLCELAKPWLHFRPKLRIAMHQINTLANVDSAFHIWWEQYKLDWCRHWHIDNWPVENMFGVIKVGHIKQFDALADLFKQRHSVTRVSLL